MTDTDDASRSSRARGRWKLLRNALLDTRSPTGHVLAEEKKHSIHSFGGYGMLTSQWMRAGENRGDKEGYHASLLKNICKDVCDQNLPRLIRVMEALGLETLDITLQCDRDRDLSVKLPSGWSAMLLSSYSSSADSSVLYRVQCNNVKADLQEKREFGIKAYRCANDTTSTNLLVHERRVQRTTLQDLIRHRSTGIDNTGKICVWDAAQTLAWAMWTLLEQSALGTHPLAVVLELGSGMAALSSLMLLKHLNRRGMTPKVFITDGQIDSVENNIVNCLLLESELRSYVECLLLQWSLAEQTMDSIQATITLIADCTHFEEYHGELLWTMIYHTAVDGTIYLCQPKRGMSWDKFASLIETVNKGSATPLVDMNQLTFVDLDQKRVQYDGKQNVTGYRSDIHHPYVFAVLKLRQETEADRKCIVDTIWSRNKE